MKKRAGFIGLLLLMLALVFVSCGGEAPDPETTACTHGTMTVSMTEVASCYEDGYEDKVCELCGYTEHTVLKGGHDFEEIYQIAADADISICKLCGVRGYLIYGEDTLELSGYFGGDLSVLAESLGAECEVELLIDGEAVATATCKSGENSTLTAKDVEKKQHDITFVNHGTESVLIKEDNMKDLLNRKGAVLVEVLAGKADRYNSINFYVQTSDPSGDYYVRYKMQYEYSETRNNYAANSCTNISNYRIKTAQLVKVNDVTETAVKSTEVVPVLTGGEISLAVRQKNVDPSTVTKEAATEIGSNGFAKDFIGGFHGDERLTSVELYLDGDKVEIYGKTAGYVVPGTYAEFNQEATMYAWGTSTADSYGRPIILHTQNFVFDSNGVKNNQSAQWLDDGYEIDAFYFQMLTLVREANGKLVCEKVASFDENGNEIDSLTIPMPVEKQTSYLSNLENRGFRYSSDVSGVFAEAGFEVINDSIVPDRMYVAARVGTTSDNKMYVSFRSPTNGQKPVKGEVFEILVYYHIDYVNPEN